MYHELNKACFVTLPSQQLANNLMTFPTRFSYITGPPLNVTDFSWMKKFQLGERFTAEFRMEFLNAFNHVWLYGIDTTPTDGYFWPSSYGKQLPRRAYWSGRVRF